MWWRAVTPPRPTSAAGAAKAAARRNPGARRARPPRRALASILLPTRRRGLRLEPRVLRPRDRERDHPPEEPRDRDDRDHEGDHVFHRSVPPVQFRDFALACEQALREVHALRQFAHFVTQLLQLGEYL